MMTEFGGLESLEEIEAMTGHVVVSGTLGWTEPRVEQLKSLYSDGLSASQIAAEMGEFSRNAVIGKVHRLGLEPRGHTGNGLPREPRKYKPRLRIVAANGNSNRQRIIVVPDAEQFQCRAVDVVPRNLTLMELEKNDCRYPYGDDPRETKFCGHKKMNGSSYCMPHFLLTRGTPPIRTRSYADIGKGRGGVFGRVA